MEIIKASGEQELFKEAKLFRSLQRAGADSALARKISQNTVKEIYPRISSSQILNKVTRSLKRENPILASRYNLKRAIWEMGPTGFPFEKYVAGILKEYGYSVQVGKIVQGHCVSHEIDVIAQKGNKHFMIECKYHNSGGIKSDVKAALYTFARFLDIQKAWSEDPRHKNVFHQAWLVTNTKCTSQAIRYADCAGLKIISWHHPKGESLERLIEQKNLYPITILSLPRFLRERIAQKNIIFVKDLLKYPSYRLSHILGVKENFIRKLQREVETLCPPT
mgnify:CR=1 FL=1